MQEPVQRTNELKRRLVNRISEAAQGLNAVLLVIAIGLAVLDLTCFLAVEIRAALPPVRTDAARSTDTSRDTSRPLRVLSAAHAQPGAAGTPW